MLREAKCLGVCAPKVSLPQCTAHAYGTDMASVREVNNNNPQIKLLPMLQVEIFCYALSPSDSSEWRQRIERESEHFLDVSSWSVPDIAGRISADAIHVAVNLNGYTKVSCRSSNFSHYPQRLLSIKKWRDLFNCHYR